LGSFTIEGGAVSKTVVIEVNYDDLTAETGSIFRECAGTLIASQSTDSFDIGAVPKTAYLTEGAHIVEMTDMVRSRSLLSQYCAGEFNMTMNGELGTISSSREFETSFGKAGISTGPTVEYRLDVTYWPHRRLPA
jgi:hypothetical protein